MNSPSEATKVKHHRIVGGVAGFFTFLFGGLDLVVFGVIALNSPLVTILPVAGIAVGIAWASWAPLHRNRPRPTSTASPAPAPVVSAATGPEPAAMPPPSTAEVMTPPEQASDTASSDTD